MPDVATRSRTARTLRLDRYWHERLRTAAFRRHQSMASIVRTALADWYEHPARPMPAHRRKRGQIGQTIRLTADEYATLAERARAEGRPMSHVIGDALEAYIG